ncbi:glycoside-pentoside-hexuronide (GPH):cation symporter [Enterobacter sp. RIT637]|uniref:glycoside-pentoside-hexuronide (GPH):cation symporter n=1 Tax=Enterobacter sp. RIT637 TaxID=2870470 RepID=UPI001C8796DF|nr:glycoside-pentoside-hexuronide (GPH):cation symporter [Enterobacter sp. RIT637]MBX8458937.1 glycoside-pentoside-hexuronide (GPH):cation symporter [Enterobacter sp. RIT637]
MRNIGFKEKIGYGLGDGASNIIWQTIMLFMAYFYTDVYGLSAFHMGTMFLVVRAFDAVADVYIGYLADHTQTRYGQFRPYLLWFSLPFGIFGALTFYTPDVGETAKIIYAYVSYTALSLFYSLVNVPYCALINNISSDSKERVSMQSYRFAFAALGGIIVSVVALPLTKILGGGDLQKGYFLAMVIMGAISTIMFYCCFAMTEEHYAKAVGKKRNFRGIYNDLTVVVKDHNWRCIFSLNIVSLIAGILKTGGAIYFVSYYLKRPDLVGLVLIIILCTRFVGALSTTVLYKNYDRVLSYKVSLILQAIILIILFTIPAEYILPVCLAICLIHFIDASSAPLQWSLLSDIIDNVEKRSNISLSGLVFSTNLFAIKIGIAVGGAIIGWLLTVGGYVGSAAIQTDLAILIVRLIFTLIPAAFVFMMYLIMRQYRTHNELQA